MTVADALDVRGTRALADVGSCHQPGPAPRDGLLIPSNSSVSREASLAAAHANNVDHPLFVAYCAKKYGEKGLLNLPDPRDAVASPVYKRAKAENSAAPRWFKSLLGLFGKRDDAETRPSGPWALRHLCHPTAKVPNVRPVYVHPYGCNCEDLDHPCHVSPSNSQLEVCAMLELAHDDVIGAPCRSTSGSMYHARHGLAKCVEVELWTLRQDHTLIGDTFGRDFFRNSPQEHALLNRHLRDYFKGRDRAIRTTPYSIPSSQMHLLEGLGMEDPQPDAPTVPHGLHKSIEEATLSRMANYLPADAYGLVSVKAAKLHLLPTPASVQCPVHQAKDASRYPGSGLTSAKFTDHNVYFMHDVSSEVGPHELVERVVADNPNAHVFVTGINPIEVIDKAGSFEPSSHLIDYDQGNFNFVFTGSEAEAYFTPTGVTVSWLRTSSIRASNGKLYQVVLLEYKLGHCLWHIFQSDTTEQDTRTFSTGSYIRIPAVLTGTWKDEWLPTKLITAILAFTDRTPDLSTRNLAAKVAQIATGTTPRLTSLEMWVALHIARERAPVQTWDAVLRRGFWRTMYALSFQWHLLAPRPDVYTYIDEYRRYRVLHPTRGGGWALPPSRPWRKEAIVNYPSWLQRASAFTTMVFTFVMPKIFIGEVISNVIMNVPLTTLCRHIYEWADLQPLRLLLTASIIIVTAILPGHIVKIFSRLAGHFWRQLWLPGWLQSSVARIITEVCGGPGATILCHLPGRGWAMQAYLWTVGTLSFLPGLVPHWVLPWVALHSPLGALLLLWYLVILLENASTYLSVAPFSVGPAPSVTRPSTSTFEWALFRWFYKHPYNRTLAACARDDVRFYAAKFSWTMKGWANYLGTYHAGQACVDGVFTPLPSRISSTTPVVRVRNVDRSLPSITILPARIPAALGASTLAIDPAGMRYSDWMAAVITAYRTDPMRYPAFTPGRSCFWDCLETLGMRAHVWYSWYMAFHNDIPTPGDEVGPVIQADIIKFSCASRVGISLIGTMTVVTQSGAGWPILNIVSSYSSVTGMYHVEPAPIVSQAPDELAFARLLCSVRNIWPAWFNDIRQNIALSPADSVPVATAQLSGLMGTHPMPRVRNNVLNALAASYSCNPVDLMNQEGYALPVTQNPDFTDYLIDFNTPTSAVKIAAMSNPDLWKRFRLGKERFRVRVSADYDHPSLEPEGPQYEPKKIGASAAADRANRNNLPPQPPRWKELQNDLLQAVKPYIPITLPAVKLEAERFTYTADVDRAARLVADLRAHPGVLESFNLPGVVQSMDSIIDQYRLEGTSRSIPIVAYFGVWGSGKTTATASYMRALPEEQRRLVRVVSHTESLRAQSKLALDFPDLRGYNFPTLASALTEACTGPLVLDDAGKFWGGVLDLLILTNPLMNEVVVNGDPAQGLAQFPIAGTQSQFDANPLSALAHHITRYATVTHRGFRLLADTLGVHTTNTTDGHLTHTVGPKIGVPVLTSSPRYVQVLTSAGRQAYTFGGVQGEDFTTDVEVDMTALEDAILDRSAYVALTRSKTGCYIHLNAMDPDSKIRSAPTASDVMNALVYAIREQGASRLITPDALVKAAFYRHLHLSMPALPWFAKVGASIDRSLYQNVFPAVTSHAVVDSNASDPSVGEGISPVAPPVENYISETHWNAKEHREVSARGGATDQFKDNPTFVDPHVHKRADTATYFLSVSKRLTTMSAKANARRMARCDRLDMCNEYDKLVPNPPVWTAMKHAEYCDLAISEYEKNRTESTVMAKLNSHDPSRTASDIRISLKGQVIKKDEKRHKKEAIPGQLIHEYDIAHTLNDAPFALFMENEIFDAFPENFIFYRRMNPSQFIEIYKARWRVGNGVHTSDVTRWDVGCDAGVLNFDVHVMHRSKFPKDYIEAYIHRRLNSRSQHGPMATMQNSGDRYTWAINSLRRAVVASLINDVTSEDTVAINGDDEAIDRFCDSKPFRDSVWEFKNQNGLTGEFSGYTLGGPVPLYSAEGIHYRALILESRDPSAQDKWLNYMDLLGWADLNNPMALAVATTAQRHMKPDLFWQALPKPLHTHFQQRSC